MTRFLILDRVRNLSSIKDELATAILRDGGGSVLVRAASMALALGGAIVLARTLGPEGYGSYAYVLALVSMLAIPAQSGLPIVVLRETALAQERGNYSDMLGVWRWSRRLVVLLSLVMVLLAWLAMDVLVSTGLAVSLDTFYLGLVLIPLMGLIAVSGGALKGLGHVALGQIPDTVLRPGVLLLSLLIAAFLVGPAPLSPSLAMGLHAMALVVSLLISRMLLTTAQPRPVSQQLIATYRSRDWVKSLPPLATIAGVGVVNAYADILILGWFRPLEEVGIYRIAASSVVLVGFGLQAISLAVAPRAARLLLNHELSGLQRQESICALVMLLMALPVVLLFLCLGEPLLNLVFGEPFGAGHVPLSILAIGQLVAVGAGSASMLMNMANKEWPSALSTVMATLTNVGLGLALIPSWGMTGAALASAASLLVWSTLLTWAVWRHVGVRCGVIGLITRGNKRGVSDASSQAS